MVNMSPLPPEVYTEADTKLYEKLSEKEVLTLFIYNKKYYFENESKEIDENNYKVRTELRKGVSVAPVKVFEVFKEATLSGNILSYKGNSVNLNDDSFEIKPFDYLGHLYVPLKETAEKLGFKVIIAFKNKVTIIMSEEKFDTINNALKENENLAVAAANLVIGKYDAYKFTSADYRMAKDKWRAFLVGTPESINVNDSGIKEKLKALEERTDELLKEMNRGENIPILWGDKVPTLSNELYEQYQKIRELAIAFGTFGSIYYKNEELKEAILFALQWMYENMYGEAELEERGWRSIYAFNWWYWYVAAPEMLTEILLIMEDYLSREQIATYLKVAKWLLDNWRLVFDTEFSPSRVVTGPKLAILLEDPERLAIAANDYHIMLTTTVENEGIRPDYCYYCHGYPYNLSYGFMLTDRTLKAAVNFAGTPLEYTSYRAYDLYLCVRYMFDAAMYKGRGFQLFTGRGTTSPDINYGIQAVNGIVPMLGCFGPEEDEYLRRYIKYSMVTEENKKLMKEKCPLPLYPVINEIFSDESLPDENTLKYAHAWFTADRAAQHRGNYAFALSMPSYRHFNYESINHANLMGWYMHDGTLYLYTETDPQEFSGENFVLNPRLAQRMPGTTVDCRKREIVSISEGWYPDNDRVGCMDFDKEFIVAGMDYTSYNMAEAENKVDIGHGGGNPKFINDLVAKKAYFMFDKECVCLGAGINSTMGSDILTTVEHRRLIKIASNPYGDDKISVNGEEILGNNFENLYINPSFARVENFAGYVFFDAENLSVSKYMHAYDRKLAEIVMDEGYKPDADEEERPFAEILINHGKNPSNASYAYAVLPYASDEALKAYSENPETEIISNTGIVQAARKTSLGITGIVFYEAAMCEDIKVSAPAIVTYKEKDGLFKIKVCEPTNKSDTLTIEIDKNLKLISCDNRFDLIESDKIKLTLNVKESYGEGYEALFEIL